MKRGVVVYLVTLFLFLSNPLVFVYSQENIEKQELEEVGNKVCPVSGEEIKEDEVVKAEYKGKIYNFCCKMCIRDFKKDPEKYIKILEESQKKEQYHQDHQHSEQHH